ncbi:MAG TPA: cyclic nucleotide-binding domain-containing protein [Gaiellaceae bacterium]|jgi:CRP/FNR family cyclic AMP-dependent transcriptional regulator|nr:cyclic nucleotide-binding domain-containing protein [Gaiellaceae bacterium]
MAAPPIALVRHLPFFADLRPTELERVAEAFDERSFHPGDVITEEGTRGGSLFVVAEGEAGVTVRGDFVRTLRPGDFFGEVALADSGRLRSATVRANTELLTYSLTASNFEPLLEAYPGVARQLLKILVKRLHEAEARLENRNQ